MGKASDEACLPFRVVREHEPRKVLGAAYVAGGVVLSFASMLVLLVLLALPMVLLEERYGPLERGGWAEGLAGLVLVALVGAAAMAITPACIRLFEKGRRLMAPPASVALARARTPPVLLLRSFADDDLFALSTPAFLLASNRYEDQLAAALRRAGPPLAIGRPGENLPQTGATRLYVADEQWRTAVRYFLERAGLVVVVVGSTQGVLWETLESARRVPPQRLMFVFPAGAHRRASIPMFERRAAGAASPQSEKEARFALFRERLAPIEALRLPSWIGQGQFLVFDAHGNGRFLENRWTLGRWLMVINPIIWLLYGVVNALSFIPWRMTFDNEIWFGRTLRPVVRRVRRFARRGD